jgi:anti-sigma factor RsiW
MQRMTGHISSESLSAYLDGEVGPAETQRLAAHLADCVHCRSRLAATRRLVGGLRRLAPVLPPPELAALVHGRVAAEAAGGARSAGRAGTAGTGGRGGPRAWLRYLRHLRMTAWGWQGLPPLHGSFSTARPLVTAGLALLVAVLLLQNGESGGPGMASLVPKLPPGQPEFLVSEAFGEVPAVLPQTTSEVAGRVFVWSDDVWVQRGVDASRAGRARAVPARSAAGRQLLAKLSDLGVLLADGSRVVLRYNYETLEIWNGS